VLLQEMSTHEPTNTDGAAKTIHGPTKTTDGQDLKDAAARLPLVEVRHIEKALSDSGAEAWPEERVRLILALNRSNNRICNQPQCGEKAKLPIRCARCLCTWYCSSKCQEQDLNAHHRWCGNSDAIEIDQGPLRTFRTGLCCRYSTAKDHS
jgi:hypothetical protein